jgi:hypothetical protein
MILLQRINMLRSDIDYHCLTTINEISKFKSHSEIDLNSEVVAFANFTMQKLTWHLKLRCMLQSNAPMSECNMLFRCMKMKHSIVWSGQEDNFTASSQI